MKTRSILFTAILILSTLACGMENVQVVQPPNLEGTVTAQALILQQGGQPPTQDPAQQAVIVVTATPEAGAAAQDPAGQVQPVAGGVTVTVSLNTSCREGPGQEFNDIGALAPGQTAEVVGKDTKNNYWIIKLPGDSSKTCWLWGQYATVTGDASQVPDVPTPTPGGSSAGAPKAPTLLDAQVKCTNQGGGNFQYKILLKWADNSSNENKFVIYSSNGNVFSTPPNKTSFSFEAVLPSGTNLSATLAAANEKGESQQVGTGSFQCP